MMRAPWYQALTGCLQMIVRDPDDIDIAKGEAELGELRERPFAKLIKALTAEQRLSLALLSLADVAVWPQIGPETSALLRRELTQPMPVAVAIGTAPWSPPADRAALSILAIARSLARDPSVPMDNLRKLMHSCAQRSRDSALYWEQYLRRVVPQAIRRPAKEALQLARAALESPPTGSGCSYVGTTYSASDGCTVGIADVGSSTPFLPIARFEPYQLAARRLTTIMHPLVPIDDYRMGYLFQTTYVEDSLDDVEQGAYDTAICRNVDTGIDWNFPGL